jgi:hypothetical protein
MRKKMKLNKSNIKKTLCMFPPGSYGGIDWKNVEVIQDNDYTSVYIPLKLGKNTVMEMKELEVVQEGMERVFGRIAHLSSVGLIARKDHTCLYLCF